MKQQLEPKNSVDPERFRSNRCRWDLNPRRVIPFKPLMNTFVALGLLLASFPGRSKAEPDPLPLPRRGIVSGKRLRVRAGPSLTANIVGQFKGGEKVFILFESDFTVEVEGKNNPWFQILDIQGTFGWVYGGFIKVDSSADDEKQSNLIASFGQATDSGGFQSNQLDPHQLELVRGFDSPTRDLFIAYQCMRALKGDAYASVPLKEMGAPARFAIPPLISSCQKISHYDDYEGTVYLSSPHIDVIKSISKNTDALITLAKTQFASGQFQGFVTDYIDLMDQLGGKDDTAIINRLKSEFMGLNAHEDERANILISEMKTRMPNDQLVSFFLKGTHSEHLFLKRRSVDGLTQCEDVNSAVPRLITLLKDPDDVVRFSAAVGLTMSMPNDAAFEPLIQALGDESPLVRGQALKALGEGGLPNNVKQKVKALIKDEDESIRYIVVSLFAKDPKDFMQPPLSEALRDINVRVRWKAERAISSLGTEESKAFLERSRSEKHEKSRSEWKWVKKVSPEIHFSRGDEIVVTLTKPHPGQSYQGFFEIETCSDCESEYQEGDSRRGPSSALELTEFASKKRDSAAGTETWTIRTGELELEGEPFPEGAGNYFLRFKLGDEDSDVIPFWLP